MNNKELKAETEAQQSKIDELLPSAPLVANPMLPAVTPEMKNFAQEYSLWVITYGQVYINALSPKFEVNNDSMEIFLSKYYGKNWLNGLVKGGF